MLLTLLLTHIYDVRPKTICCRGPKTQYIFNGVSLEVCHCRAVCVCVCFEKGPNIWSNPVFVLTQCVHVGHIWYLNCCKSLLPCE